MRSSAARTHADAPERRTSRRLFVPAVRVPERVHDSDHTLLWQVRGGSDVRLGADSHALSAGQALWVPAGIGHELHVHENSVVLPMFFEAKDAATTIRGVTTIAVDRELRTLFFACVQAQHTIIQPDVNITRQILSLLEDRPRSETSMQMPTSPAAAGIAETLRFNPGDDRSAGELAHSVHASLRTVQRAFKAETGMTLRQWRIGNRMEAAAALLRANRGTQAVAHRVGYGDTSAFRRVFKAHYGMTPGEYSARFTAR